MLTNLTKKMGVTRPADSVSPAAKTHTAVQYFQWSPQYIQVRSILILSFLPDLGLPNGIIHWAGFAAKFLTFSYSKKGKIFFSLN
jgi:hypothetical protein